MTPLIQKLSGFFASVLFVACLISLAPAQQCPQASKTGEPISSQVRSLEGRLIFHEGIREWFELKLDHPVCGQRSIQLVRQASWTSLEVLRDCRVRSTGSLGSSLTGYYSLDVYQSVDKIHAVGTCPRKTPFPNYSNVKPDESVRRYRVDMHLDYSPGDHPITFRVTSAGKTLTPWQAYASYSLTGGFVLYGHCGKGFVVDEVFGTQQAEPAHFAEPRTADDMASFDPESAAASGMKDLHLGYTCVRAK